MKQKYEKPEIETEDFALEMMRAEGCTCGPGDPLQFQSGYFLPFACDCACTGQNDS